MNTQSHLFDFLKSRSGLSVLTLVVVAVLFLIATYGDYLLRLLPYGLIVLCPLMHLLLHRGHNGHRNHSDHVHDEEQ